MHKLLSLSYHGLNSGWVSLTHRDFKFHIPGFIPMLEAAPLSAELNLELIWLPFNNHGQNQVCTRFKAVGFDC